MYWPIGTPRIYATSSSRAPNLNLFVSNDGLSSASDSDPALPLASAAYDDADQLPLTTPTTPITPSILPVDLDEFLAHRIRSESQTSESSRIPFKDPIIALRAARAGHLLASITATSITIWQAKPTVILAVVVRSESSLQLYGQNVDLLLRPDAAIVVVRTDLGYLITYSIATDGESCVYKPHFPDYHNVRRRKQSLSGGQSGLRPDQILWGPGEGLGVRDVSVRFRMVIKVDAGIESALALDDELVVATRKPAAVQCIRWTPDKTGHQTRTEILSRMGWVERHVSIVEMTHDRPMNLATWIMSDGRAYAVQRLKSRTDDDGTDEAESKRLFKGHCFHVPSSAGNHAVMGVINARFSLIAVGCADGTIKVYSVRDYAGNIAHSHTQKVPASMSATGAFTSLSYSPDGYSLFAGFEKGWATWSMFGKLGSHSFGADEIISSGNGEQWLHGVRGASWIGGGSEVLLIGPSHEAVWSLEMAKSAVTGCYNEANVFRTVLQTPTAVMVYRGYDLPDLTSISAEPFLWHTAKVPSTYLLNQWPIRQAVISPDGRYVAVAGSRGLAHYSVNSGRWKTFANEATENEFQVRGGMCWYQHILVAAVESNRSFQIRLYSRDAPLDPDAITYRHQIPAPVVLITTSGDDSLLVYTHENLLYHFIFTPWADSVRLVQVGQIAFHGIVRSPARVRGLSWILPESQLVEGDPSQDVAVASVFFLVDGKLVLLSPSCNQAGQLKYDMRIIAQNVEYHACMRDQLLLNDYRRLDDGARRRGPPALRDTLRDSLWVFDGMEVKAWASVTEVLDAASGDSVRELPMPVSVPVDFYPLSILLEKGLILGVESDLVQRRDVGFSFFHFAIRTHLVFPDVLHFYLRQNRTEEAVSVSGQYEELEYFSHGLEILLHKALDEEAETSPKPEDAVLPRVLSLISSSKDYLDVVLQCTRKTDVRHWQALFAYLPPAQELFEESLQRGSLKTAGGYLIILHTMEELESSSDQSVRVLSRAMQEGDWELCKELARFLAALDDTGEILREAMQLVNVELSREREGLGSRLETETPPPTVANGHGRNGAEERTIESDFPSASDASSAASNASPSNVEAVE
ncbi:hypothetical protein RJ55_07860 [Drechmeria coniospora]|nr:hypothetical protein RJ55_07860 [Drechmeria coniospora]